MENRVLLTRATRIKGIKRVKVDFFFRITWQYPARVSRQADRKKTLSH